MLIDNGMSTLLDPDAAPVGRGERRKQHTKRRLLDAAAEAYADLGVEGATISAITERADVGLGTFYLHFEDKDAIAISVSGFVYQRILYEENTASDAVRAVGGDPDPLAIFARVVCGRAADSPGLVSALLQWDGPSKPRAEFDAEHVGLRQAILPHLARRCAEGMARGLYRTEDTDLAANAVLGLLVTTIPAWVERGRNDWNVLASFVERSAVSMFRR